MNLCILDRGDLARVRPGSSNNKGGKGKEDNPMVNLVLFRIQDRHGRNRMQATPVGAAASDGKDSGGKGSKGSSQGSEYYRDGDKDTKKLWDAGDAEDEERAAAEDAAAIEQAAYEAEMQAQRSLWEPPQSQGG